MSEALKIYEDAIRKIANLNCRTLEQYVAKADAIAVDALVAVENLVTGATQTGGGLSPE